MNKYDDVDIVCCMNNCNNKATKNCEYGSYCSKCWEEVRSLYPKIKKTIADKKNVIRYKITAKIKFIKK